jgi:hypothetical protein
MALVDLLNVSKHYEAQKILISTSMRGNGSLSSVKTAAANQP